MIDRIAVWALTTTARIRNRLENQRGQDVMEYALLTGGIALAIAAVLLFAPFTTQLGKFATTVGNCIGVGANYSCP